MIDRIREALACQECRRKRRALLLVAIALAGLWLFERVVPL